MYSKLFSEYFTKAEESYFTAIDNKGQAHQNSKVIDWGGVEEPCKGDTPE